LLYNVCFNSLLCNLRDEREFKKCIGIYTSFKIVNHMFITESSPVQI
jgi:hypothetical protein